MHIKTTKGYQENKDKIWVLWNSLYDDYYSGKDTRKNRIWDIAKTVSINKEDDIFEKIRDSYPLTYENKTEIEHYHTKDAYVESKLLNIIMEKLYNCLDGKEDFEYILDNIVTICLNEVEKLIETEIKNHKIKLKELKKIH